MKTKYESKFEKDLKNIKDKILLKRIKKIIENVKKANRISELSNLRKLKGYETFYRIRLANYRIGIEITETDFIFVRILHRKNVYRYFPPYR